jgi:uncharacterized SAM-binding protein YcdF (DUF218 family)
MFVLASVAAGGWLTREPLLREAADLWIVSDPISRGDAIVVLGGGLATRPFEAAELWHRGLADKILISQASEERAVGIGAMRDKSGIFATCGRDPRPRWVSSRRRLEWPNGAMCVFFSGEEPEALRGPEAEMPSHNEFNREILLKLGVPATAIATFGTANKNTRDEAVALREWAERNTASAFIIPTEFFSARRVRWIFRREFFRNRGPVLRTPGLYSSGLVENGTRNDCISKRGIQIHILSLEILVSAHRLISALQHDADHG